VMPRNVLIRRLYFSTPNVVASAYRQRYEQDFCDESHSSPRPRTASQRFGNTVVLFWYDRKAESLRLA
jgi:hypothetical protein